MHAVARFGLFVAIVAPVVGSGVEPSVPLSPQSTLSSTSTDDGDADLVLVVDGAVEAEAMLDDEKFRSRVLVQIERADRARRWRGTRRRHGSRSTAPSESRAGGRAGSSSDHGSTAAASGASSDGRQGARTEEGQAVLLEDRAARARSSCASRFLYTVK